MLHLSAKHSRSLVWWKNSTRKTFWKTVERTFIPFGSLVEYYPISSTDLSRIHQFGKKVFVGLFFGYVLYAEGISKGDVLVADLEELETMDASEIYWKDSMQKMWYFTKKMKKSSRRWTNQTFWTRSGSENIHLDSGTHNSRRKSHRFSWRIRWVSSTTSRLTSGCRWSDKRFLVHVRKLHFPLSRWNQSQTLLASFFIPLIYMDVSRTTRTNLDVMQARRIDDYWNIDGSRDLSDSWTGFTQFTLLEEQRPDGYMWSGRRLTKRQYFRLDHLWPEFWIKWEEMLSWRRGKNRPKRNRNPIMPEDYEEFISLKPMAPAMPLDMQEE